MTTLKEEEPFAFVADIGKLATVCSFCFACDKTVNICKVCHTVYYCSRTCQKSDWVNHKKECLLLKRSLESSDEVPPTAIRLVARILLKSETALAQKSFNDRSWKSLEFRFPEPEDEMAPTFVKMIRDIIAFMEPLKSISEVDAAVALSKVQSHKIDIYNAKDCMTLLGIGIYLGFSVHKHSCVPNSQLIICGKRASLHCFDQTRTKYSTDLTISYSGFPIWKAERKDFLIKKYFKSCTCAFCVDENHIFKRMGSSCHVTCCEDGAGILDENSSGPYRCNKCGTPSDITVGEVKRAETKIDQFLKKRMQPNYVFDLMKLKRLVHETEKILSLFNSYFICLYDANTFTGGPELITNRDVQIFAKQINDKRLKAYSYYLDEMDARMALALLDRVVLKLILDSADGYNVSTAFEAAERVLGERHPAIVFHQKVIDDFKRVNEKKRDELFREAANFKW